KVYANHPETIQRLKEEIERQIRKIHGHRNFVKRIHTCHHTNVAHLTDILFHV
ncbi:hypothetical protein WN55_03379, partial [Dufourea novaeangliae]